MYLESQGVLPGEHRFGANVGVKQGDGASPELFALFFDRVYPHVLEYFDQHDLPAATRHLYTVASLQLFMLAFADDLALIAGSCQALQALMTCFEGFCKTNNLAINTDKTKVMLVNCKGEITCGGTPLEVVH